MSCSRSCSGTPLCSALNLCCLQLHHDCGKECGGLLEGYSTIQVNAAGQLEVCSNVGGVCECDVFSPEGSVSTVTNNNNGTWTHNNGDGTVVTLDVCEMLGEAYAAIPWVVLPLGAGWVAEAGMQVPQYRCLCDGSVQLRGCMEHDDADDDNAVPTAIATLPASQGVNDCRPASGIRFQGGSNCASIEITSAGVITTNPSITPPTRCLDGLEFYVA